MKYVPYLAIAILAICSSIPILAQQGNRLAIAGTSAITLADSIIICNYINLSEKDFDINAADDAMQLANLALTIATATNDQHLINDATAQKKKVQSLIIDEIKKQNKLFTIQTAGIGFIDAVPAVTIIVLLLAACVYLFIIYKNKNRVIKIIEASRLKLEHRNRELLHFQKEILEKKAERELNIENNDDEDEDDLHMMATEAVAKTNSIKDRLIPMIAHDIRSPLASLQHMLSLTRESVLSPEEFQKLSLSLEADIYNLRGMLDNMLLWTREQMVEIKIQKTIFDISEAMRNVILMHRNSLIAKNILIHNYLQENLEVYSDRDIIMAVMRNIFSNAVKFTETNRNIYINQIYLNNKIYISIKDEGKGINKETLEKLNNNEHITTRGTANEKGTGIGIMFTKDLIKKINESFDITSIPGNGTSVTFSVAITNEDEQEGA